MRVIRPVAITDANFVASNIPENDHAVWSAGATYAAGARVIRASTHRRYEALTAVPAGVAPESDPTKWLDIGPTSRWAMFDDRVGTISTRASSITVQLQPGSVDSLALLDTDAESVTVTMTVGSTTVYEGTRSFNASGVPITSWYAWFFEPIGRKSSVKFGDLPLYPSAVITITVAGGGATATPSVGTLILGRSADLGITEADPEIGINDYSRKQTDDFGVTMIVERAWSKRMTIRSKINNDQVDSTQRLLAGLRARPVLWIGDDDYDALTVFGIFKDFKINIPYDTVSYCSLTIEGLT